MVSRTCCRNIAVQFKIKFPATSFAELKVGMEGTDGQTNAQTDRQGPI